MGRTGQTDEQYRPMGDAEVDINAAVTPRVIDLAESINNYAARCSAQKWISHHLCPPVTYSKSTLTLLGYVYVPEGYGGFQFWITAKGSLTYFVSLIPSDLGLWTGGDEFPGATPYWSQGPWASVDFSDNSNYEQKHMVVDVVSVQGQWVYVYGFPFEVNPQTLTLRSVEGQLRWEPPAP